jgi:hypothetical protein
MKKENPQGNVSVCSVHTCLLILPIRLEHRIHASVQISTSTKRGFKICTAQMTFNPIINTVFRSWGKKEQMLIT